MTSRNAWKNTERRHSRLIGTTRTPLSGSNGKVTSSDSFSNYWYLESKHRSSFPVFEGFMEISGKALDRDLKPAIVYHKTGFHNPFADRFVMMKFMDFVSSTDAIHPAAHEPDLEAFFLGKWYLEHRYVGDPPLLTLFNETAVKATEEGKVPIIGIHVSGRKTDLVFTSLDIFLRHVTRSESVPVVQSIHRTGRR